MDLINKLAVVSLALILSAGTVAETSTSAPVQVRLETDFGNILLELLPGKAPVTVENFLGYVDRFYYDGVIFHRVVEGFVIQSGGYTFDMVAKEPGEAIVNESANGLSNLRGTIAMARMSDPDSARAQFYINLGDNTKLDARPDKPGYTVFGRVVDGMKVVDRIAAEPVRRADRFTHLPKIPVRILKARRVGNP